MSEIIQLCKETTVEDAKVIIIDNLKTMHSSKFVNELCTFHGLDDLDVANEALILLISEGCVMKRENVIYDKFKRAIYVPYYRYNSLLDLFAR